MSEFQTLKSDLTKTRLVKEISLRNTLDEEEIELKIERFAFTANNVTYGVAGETIGYWRFFPALDDQTNEWGCIPMWGFAEIIGSNNKNLAVGERVFGFYPAAESLIMTPSKISDDRFIDGKKSRQELPSVYNNYVRMSKKTAYDSTLDNIQALLFPLHLTAFCLCDLLQEQSYLGASQVIIISASSKTAIGIAQGLANKDQAPNLVGFTSTKNVSFVENLGCYDEVISYDQFNKLNADATSVLVDMAGNREILESLNERLKQNMLKCFTVGMTHWDNEILSEDALDQMTRGERTEFFFAPVYIQKRINEWGHERFDKESKDFMHTRLMQSKKWMQVKEIQGLENFVDIYNQVVAGNIKPYEGLIVIL